MKKLLASPFFHFLILGGLIFILYGFLNRASNHPEGYDIIITEDHQVQMAVNHQRNFGELPDQATLNQLIDAEVQSEIYYREALRLGLDENDEIIRRRLKQKYAFIQDDAFIESKPTEEEVLNFYKQNQDKYMSESKYSFEHFYFNPDQRTQPQKDALAFIQNPQLKSDAFHISSPVVNQTLSELRNTFGFDFSESIKDMKAGDTLVDIASGFGHHVIRITKVEKEAILPFETVKNVVMGDFQRNYRNERNMASFEELKKKYNIKVEELE